MKTINLNTMAYERRYMDMLSKEASNYESYMGDFEDSFEDDEFAYEDEFAGGSNNNLPDQDRIITFNVTNKTSVKQTAVLFGASIYDLNDTAIFSPNVQITVDQSSHFQVRESSKANPVVYNYLRIILNDSTPAQFANSLEIGEITTGGIRTSALLSPNSFASSFQQQATFREGKYRIKIGGENYIIIPLNPNTSFTLQLQKGAELNVDRALSGKSVLQSNSRQIGTMPTQKLVVSKK